MAFEFRRNHFLFYFYFYFLNGSIADPKQRIILEAVAVHPWVVEVEGPLPQYLCWCKRNQFKGVESAQGRKVANVTGND